MRNFNAILLVLKHSFGIYFLDSNGILLECFKVFMRLDKFLGFFPRFLNFCRVIFYHKIQKELYKLFFNVLVTPNETSASSGFKQPSQFQTIPTTGRTSNQEVLPAELLKHQVSNSSIE